jgi:outer membrane protein with beta-barrel domain
MKILSFILITFFSLFAIAATEVDDSFSDSSVSTQAEPDSSGPHIVSRVVPQASILASSFVGPDSSHFTTIGGYSLGATVDFGYSDFVIESGLLYRTMGSKYSVDGAGITYNSGFLAVPIMAKYYFPKFDSTSIYFKAGFLPEVVVNQSVTTDNVVLLDNNPHYRYFDFEAAIGVGAKISISPSYDVFVETVYTKGLTNVFDDTVGMTVYNAAVMLTAGFGFNL